MPHPCPRRKSVLERAARRTPRCRFSASPDDYPVERKHRDQQEAQAAMNTTSTSRIAQPYLFFDGRCDEALEFYRRALDAEWSPTALACRG